MAVPPLYIEDIEQRVHHVEPESRHSIDTDTAYDNEASVEEVATPGLLEEDNFGNAYFYIKSEDQHERNIIREFRGSDTNTNLVNRVVTEEVITPGLPEEDEQLVGDALYTDKEEQHEHDTTLDFHHGDADTNLHAALVDYAVTPEPVEEHDPRVVDAVTHKRAAFPLSIHEPENLPKSKTALLPVTNPPESLSTLSAFMQTRCHKNKRRKLDVESRYFSSTPKSSTMTSSVKTDTLEKPTASTVLLSSPVIRHNIQNLSLYPKYHSNGSDKPLLLIVSTHLLRSDSTLVRSLEGISSSRSLRLIFRDYQRANPSQPPVIDEADLTVSPVTGVILASSHETTQKYLPGQGPPGIDSPLHGRIVQATPRYEMLYVLVRSPLETTMDILSSVRDLTTYCMSLNRVCNIKVLLIATDDVLEWILSIAAKYTMNLDLIPPVNATESMATAPQFHDDHTQWELFLRSAGLNSFAAESILAVLKTSSAQSELFEDVDQVSPLSRFVEMPCRSRMEMFQNLVGQRVISRVNKALEMDWQIDWAVDLT